MPVPSKPSPVTSIGFTGQWPKTLPALPGDLVEAFPSLSQWQNEFKTWWFQTRTLLDRLQQDHEDGINANSNAIQQLKSDLANVQSQILALQKGP